VVVEMNNLRVALRDAVIVLLRPDVVQHLVEAHVNRYLVPACALVADPVELDLVVPAADALAALAVDAHQLDAKSVVVVAKNCSPWAPRTTRPKMQQCRKAKWLLNVRVPLKNLARN
jgi:ethanolamine ammonia-lyase small subunit